MNTSIQPSEPKDLVQPSGASSRSAAASFAGRQPPGLFRLMLLLAGAMFLLCGAPAAHAERLPTNCTGSGLGISLFTSLADVHIGDTLFYSVNVFNGALGSGRIACDAEAIQAFVVTPDGRTNVVNLSRTLLHQGEADFYLDVVSYVVRAQDIQPDGTLLATARDIGIIHQNDTDSIGGGFQGVNTEVNLPCVLISALCVGGVGENGLIQFSGTVTNCGNNTLVGVTVTNFYDNGFFTVLFPTNLARGQSATFSGSWIPLNPCVPSTAILTVRATDEFTSTPTTVTNFTTYACQNTTTPGIVVTKVCPAGPVSPGQLLTFSGSVSNTGNVTLTNIVVVNNQPAANTPVFTLASLAPGAAANFTGSYTAPTNCSVSDTLTATATSRCGVGVSSVASATCPIVTAPQIAVTATCPATPILPGGSLTYSGTVRNTGNITLTNVVVVSDRPAANTTVFTVASLAPGASASFTSSATVPANACSVITTFSGTGRDLCTLVTVANTIAVTCTVTTAPAIAVTLTCPAVSASAGGVITYTGTVRNSGDVTLNNVTVVNSQSSPSTVFTVASLAPGVSANYTASFTAPANACSVSSTVTATGTDNCTAVVVTNSASTTCPLITTPSLVVAQNCPVSPAIPGGLMTYSGSVSNAGNITLTNVVVLNNLSGATPVFTAATLASGAVASFSGSFLAPTNCSVTSISTATARSICGIAVTGTVSSTCPIVTAPQIAVTAVCPPTPVVPGGTLIYSGTVRNTGNITLTNVVVVSDRPAANTTVFTVAALAPGASASFTSSVTVPANACAVTTTFSGTGRDICTLTPVANTVATTCTGTTTPAITVTLACPVVSASAGGVITYTGTVRNSGDVTLNNVTVVNSQSSPTTVFTVASLAVGVSANFTASFTTPANVCSVTSTVTATGTDNCTAALVTNSASATCPLITIPGLAITQNCPVSPAIPGGLLTYSGTVQNTGNITLTNVVVTSGGSGIAPPPPPPPPSSNTVTTTFWVDDALPAGANTFGGDPWLWVSSNPAPFSGTLAHQSTLSAGTHQHIFRFATASFAIGVGDVLVNYVYLDPANMPSEVMVQWNSGSSTFDHRAYWGANSIPLGTDGTTSRRYMGPLPAAGQWVRLEVPASLVGLEGSSLSGMAFTLYGGRATWDASGKATQSISSPPPTPPTPPISGTTVFTAATLAPGAIANFTASYTVPADNLCSFTSTLAASAANTCTGIPVTASVATTCPLLTTPAIVVTQACPTTPVVQGSILTYSGTVRNAGNVTLTNIVVVNNWPAPNMVIFTTASLAPGETRSFTGSYVVPLNCCVAWSTVQARGQGCDGVTVTDTDSGTCPVSTAPQLVVTKLCPPTALRPGELLQYSGTVRNAGNISLVNVTLVNTQSGAGSPIFGPVILAPGESATYEGSYVVPSDFCGTDTVTASGLDACSFAPVAGSVTTTCPIVTTPRIAITQRCPPQPTPHGSQLVFSGTVSNPGNVTLTNVFVFSSQPTNNAPVIGPITLTPGGFFDFTGSFTAPPLCCEIMNTLTANGQDRCSGVRVAASATAICPLLYTPAIALVQICPPAPLPMGSLYAFSGFVTNTGDAILTNVVVFGPQGTNTVLLGPVDLAPGESEPYSGSVTVPFFNTCAVIFTVTSQETCKGTWVTNTVSCPVATTPQIAVTAACPVAPVLPGSLLTYSGTVQNTGNITLTNVVVVSDRPGTNTTVFTVPTLAPGAISNFIGAYLVPANACAVTTTFRGTGQSLCTSTTVTNTVATTCPITTTPGLLITESCPPGPVSAGDTVAFGGLVSNSGNVTLTNVLVVSSQSGNPLVLGPLTLAPGASMPFGGSYIATGGSNPTTNTTIVTNGSSVITTNTTIVTVTNTTVTVTTNNVTPTFGTINPDTGILTDRFNVVDNLHGLMFANQDQQWGDNLFYATRHPATGPDQFVTISTPAGSVTDRFALTATNYDALTLAAPDIGHGEKNYYYVRNGTTGVSTFGVIKAAGASSSADLAPVLPNTGYNALAFAAANVSGFGENLLYSLRTDAGVTTLGTIYISGAMVVTDRYTLGTDLNFDSMVFAPTTVSTWGTAIFAYLRHDTNGSIIGTIDPVTHAVTDRVSLGTNILSDLTFTVTDVGYGPNLFYYLRPARTILTTNTVTDFTFNTETTFITNTVTVNTTNVVVTFTTTNTVTATGIDTCQARAVAAAASCVGSVTPSTRVRVMGAPAASMSVFRLSFPTVSGVTYILQYKNTLNDPVWTDLETIVGTGGDVPITDAGVGPQPTRFYRVIVSP